MAALAADQHGVVSRNHLSSLAVSNGSVAWWVRTGRLHRVHRGVYAVGHRRLTREGIWMAAVLACGPGAVLSHRDAAALWGIRPTSRSRVDVTAARSRVKVDGVDVHRVRRLDDEDRATHRGIPTTTVARTLVDLADVLNDRQLARAIDQAEILHLLDARALHDAAQRANGRRGMGRLERALAAEPDLTKSELERAFVELCENAGIPRPQVNTAIVGLEVDFAWPDRRLAVEADSWTFHRTRQAFERDRGRDQQLARAGIRVLRFTHRQVEDAPADVAATLRAALAR